MNFKSVIAMLCAGSMPAWAANNASVQAPMTGYIFDPQARAVRPMIGMPGGAYLGTPIATGLDAAWVSPDGSTAFAMEKGQLTLYAGLGGANPTGVPVNGAIAPDYFAWSPASTGAAIYSSTTRQAQILTHTAAGFSAGMPIDLSGIAGSVSAMAFDGQRIIVAATSANAGSIYSLTAQSGPQVMASAVSPSAIALAGADLYFADKQAAQLWQVRSYATQPAPVLFAADASISSPAALQLSSDSARLYVANSGNQTLGVYNVSARSLAEALPLSFSPTKLDRFGDAGVFALNAAGGGRTPLFVLSDHLSKTTVYFVPMAGGGPVRPPVRYRPQ
ncbi:MAG: hypothetical protein ABSC93_02300 [Bryobacteraceae bacterium]|jgi:hypothetical protein